MKRPSIARCCAGAAAIGLALVSTFPAAQSQPADGSVADALPNIDDWYRVEVLVFVRDDAGAFAAENWEPLPALAYPEDYRYLIDPALADERLARSGALASHFDERGVQTLLLPREPAGIEELPRPDAVLEPLPLEPDPGTGAASGAESDTGADPESPPNGQAPAEPAGQGVDTSPLPAAEDGEDIDEEQPLFALPFQQLARDALEFRAQAAQLARGGQRVLFHSAWWAPLANEAAPVDVLLDRSGDVAPADWPALQGSLRLYRTRYLHAEFDLWLNTDGRYLPDAWSIPAPPRSRLSYRGVQIDGSEADPFAEPRTLDDLLPPADDAEQETFATDLPEPYPGDDPAAGDSAVIVTGIPAGPVPAAGTAAGDPDNGPPQTEDAGAVHLDPNPYPYRHAIRHVQASRMRGGEIHYLDHPVIGVVIRVTPAGEDNLPSDAPERAEWRARHSLPVQRMPAEEEESQATAG